MVTAALVAAVAVLVALSVPPRRLTLETPLPDGTIPGVIHVHTNRSDGRSGPDAGSGRRHPACRPAQVPSFSPIMATPQERLILRVARSGVLPDAVEISTTGDTYLALDMPAASHPLGDARGVVEDVSGSVDSASSRTRTAEAYLSWRDWEAPFDGIEWLNPDTSWRSKCRSPAGDRAGASSPRSRLSVPITETIAHLLGNTSPVESVAGVRARATGRSALRRRRARCSTSDQRRPQ
jgi:hypothetical protein